MTFTLEKVIKNEPMKPPRILLYAPPKVGKSYFAAHIPNHIFMDIEEGLDGVRNSMAKEGKEVVSSGKIKNTSDAVDVLKALYEEEHDYEALIVDTADWLEKLICNEVAQQHDKDVVEDIPYGRGYSLVVDRWSDFLKYFDLLRSEKNMMIVLLSHADVKKFTPPLGDEFDMYMPKLYGKKDKSKTSLALLQEFSDIIMFADFKVETKEVGEGFSKRKQAVGNPERILYLNSSNPSFVAGNRYGLPDKITFDYEVFDKVFKETTNIKNNKGE